MLTAHDSCTTVHKHWRSRHGSISGAGRSVHRQSAGDAQSHLRQVRARPAARRRLWRRAVPERHRRGPCDSTGVRHLQAGAAAGGEPARAGRRRPDEPLREEKVVSAAARPRQLRFQRRPQGRRRDRRRAHCASEGEGAAPGVLQGALLWRQGAGAPRIHRYGPAGALHEPGVPDRVDPDETARRKIRCWARSQRAQRAQSEAARRQEPQEEAQTGPVSLGPVHASIAAYYTERVRRFGATPLGVDWHSAPSQMLRFVQLLKGIDFTQPVSLHDVGCGYGALLDHLADRHPDAVLHYVGSDLSPEMIRRARRRWRARPDTRFDVAPAPCPDVDWSVASGVFNVNVDQPEAAWEEFVAATLSDMAAHSAFGFAVNFLDPAPGSGSPQFQPLYRVPAEQWAAHCERAFGCEVELIRGYGLRESTLLARRRAPPS
ncbi:MAG: class I SAM-dependent methyltransferase [Gammaproteobacteria bacterium]|nr:class I SAM-dependent methyltransferase [Gammaproteobacteria bacterium]